MPKTEAKNLKKADQYNDPKHNYLHYWDDRSYEHKAEVIALRRLLDGKHFNKAVDIGGGYGRLSTVLEEYSDRVILTEPSKQQLDIARDYLKGHNQIEKVLMQADDLTFADSSVDLAIMIRVMHHLPDPEAEFKEIRRVLQPDGIAIVEVANFDHFKNRLKYLATGKRLPREPVDIRSRKNRTSTEIPFVNHNPNTVIKQFAHAGLKVERVLSVSNLRSVTLKRVLPQNLMLAMEGFLQPTLSRIYFGPSVFFLVSKAK